MKKAFSFLLIMVLVLTVVACGKKDVVPDAKITGAEDITVYISTDSNAFDPLNGVTATDEVDGDITSKIKVSGTVDTSLLDTYTVIYKVTGSNGKEVSVTREVTVAEVPKTASITKPEGDLTIELNEAIDLMDGITALDEVDGDITSSITYTSLPEFTNAVPGIYLITYVVTGSDDLEATINRRIIVAAPVVKASITVTPDYIEVDKDSTFDPMSGVTATDEDTGDLTANVVVDGTVDTAIAGSYYLVYTVVGSDSETAYANRTVVVLGIANTASISGVSNVLISKDVAFNVMDGVSATDTVDGDLTSSIVVTGSVDISIAGNYILTYKVTGSDGNEVVKSRTITVTESVGEPTVIRIMHGAPYEVDPFHEAFTGDKQEERQAQELFVENMLNVDIRYVPFPAEAAWGPGRVSSIIGWSTTDNHQAEIYWIQTDWLGQLVNAGAIAPIETYLDTYGQDLDDSYIEVGSFQKTAYGFMPGVLTVDTGLYYNAELVQELGVANPTQMYLDGDWNWSALETWATSVQTALTPEGEGWYALGGNIAAWAEQMVPLNGGSLINSRTNTVAFHQQAALDTYEYLSGLWDAGLYEPLGTYDQGTLDWQTGKVAMHPGQLWFINADNRWGTIPFELGWVPFPMNDDYTGGYKSPLSGVAIYGLASNMEAEKEALVFQAWNALQQSQEENPLTPYEGFELVLAQRFDKEIYVEAYMQVYDKVYLDLIGGLGISQWTVGSWNVEIAAGIKDKSFRTRVNSIKATYTAALNDYLGK